MKRVFKRLLICILIIMVVSNGSLALYRSNVYAFDLGATLSNLLTGLVGILTWIPRAIVSAVEIAIFDLLGGLFNLGVGDIASYGALPDVVVTPFHILFNKVAILDVNFLDFNGVSGTVLQFRQAVAGWYYSMRLLATMILLVILVYIGIRMAISTIASEKARYKKMLVDWVTSLVLLFLLHYIMVFVLACNTALVNALSTGLNEGSLDSMTNMMTILQALMFSVDVITGVTAMFLYGMMVFQTLSFFIAYTKRMFTIGFLIIIAPLITITYSIDKIGDQKAQALNTWLKNFVYNILLQPFQCILYMVFARVALDMLLGHFSNAFDTSHFAQGIFAVLAMQFIKEGEKIVKKIFGFDKAADTLSDMASSAVMLHSALSKGKEAGAKVGAGAASVARNYKSAIGKAKNSVSKASSKISSAASDVTKKIGENTRVGRAVGQRYQRHVNKKNERIRSKQQAREKKSQDKIETERKKLTASATQLANNRLKAQGQNRKATKQEIEQAENDIKAKKANTAAKKASAKANRQEKGKKVISGVKTATKKTGTAIKGMNDFRKSIIDDKKLFGALAGVATAGMGFAAGDFLSIKEAVAGYQIGSGVYEGYYKNSNKTLQSNYSKDLAAAQNLTGIDDAQKLLAIAQSMGENDIGKDIKDQLSEIKQLLKNKENGNQIITDFRAGMVTAPQLMNTDKIGEILDKAGYDGTDDERTDLIGKLGALGSLMAYQQLSNGIENAAGMGIDRETFATILDQGIVKTGQAGNGQESAPPVTTEYKYRYFNTTTNNFEEVEVEGDVDVNALGQEIGSNILKDMPNIDEADITALQTQLSQIEQFMQIYNQANPEGQTYMLNSVNQAITQAGGQSIDNEKALRTELDDKMLTLRTAIANLENSDNTPPISNN